MLYSFPFLWFFFPGPRRCATEGSTLREWVRSSCRKEEVGIPFTSNGRIIGAHSKEGRSLKSKSALGFLLLQNTGYFSCWISVIFWASTSQMARAARAGQASLWGLKTWNEEHSCLMCYIPHAKFGYLKNCLIILLNLRSVKNNSNSSDHIHISEPSSWGLWCSQTEEMAQWLRCLVFKHEDLSSNPGHLCKS